ncbi:MAG TPA: substrate-binding domain-containing protein, partial [Pseudonocardiaceae bacterium]|nr:substrate-binding domain-containing protein [Pseudonocardiaceae bacterium]
MGRHRAETSDTHLRRVQVPGRNRPRRRWPLATFVAVVLFAAGWFGWVWVHGRMVERPAASVVDCPAGGQTIQLAVVPSIADVIGSAAAAYNDSEPVVNDHCVRVNVSAIDAQTVLAAVAHGWDTGKLGPRPQAWIVDSTLWTNQLPANVLGDAPQSLATSPVVLAMPPDAAKAVTSTVAPTFAALPALIAKANGWADFGAAAWGQFTVALPSPAANTASMLAVTAMLDPATPQGQAPVTAGLLDSDPVRQNLDNLAVGQSTASTHDALAALGRTEGIQGAPFSAVPTLEVDLYQRNLGGDGNTKPTNILDEVRLTGPTPFADFPYTPLS